MARQPKKQVLLRLDAEDNATLMRCARLEKLSANEILRRALRGYAQEPALSHRPREGLSYRRTPVVKMGNSE